MINAITLVILAYLAGSMPFGYWIVRVFRGEDIRLRGSGNIGGTNVWRVHGPRFGLPVVVLDVLKGFAPVFAASLSEGHIVAICAGAAAMIGHWRPLFLNFRRGGKMVATYGGAAIGIAPLAAAVGVLVWICVFVVGRYASLASIVAALSLAPAAVLLRQPWPVVVFMAVAAFAVVWLHRANIGRLLRGEEHRFRLWARK